MGNPATLEEVPRRVLRQHGRQHAARPGGRHEATGRRYPWIDIERAGIYGHSGGGYATADAMFRYPDFFKVGISEAGNHDNREYEDDWGERYQGLLSKPRRHHELRRPGQSEYRQEPEGALAAGARHDGRQRAAV
jgi:hypothetical protein